MQAILLVLYNIQQPSYDFCLKWLYEDYCNAMFGALLARIAIAFTLYRVYAHAAKCTATAIFRPQENVRKDHKLHATSLYRLKVEQAVADIKDEDLKLRASRVGDFGTFMWLSVICLLPQ
jgi:hypothetical protein